MVDTGGHAHYETLQKGLEACVRRLLASSSSSIQDEIGPALTAAVPRAAESTEQTRAQYSVVGAFLRSKCVQLAQEAAAAQQPPMQYTLKGAGEPAIPRLMQIAIACQRVKLIDESNVLYILEELQDAVVAEDCLDIISWLEHNSPMLSTYKTGNTQLIRLCNAIHKRLGKHEVIPRARLLILIARCSTPFDRSGVNVQSAFAPADPPPVEDVPPDAVDTANKPVDSTLYTAFWKLQPLIQDANKVVKSAADWDSLQGNLGIVLDGLAKSTATVAAVHASGSNESAAAAGGGSSEVYLSSYKLFGLQLADSAFRRGFLVQVLIFLRTLLVPGKQPVDTLKDKARMQAVALEGRVYQLLEATPQGGREFAKAVREVLAREMTWVDWKKGKVLAPKGQAPAPTPAPTGKAQQQPDRTCVPWELPALPSLSAAVQAQQEKAQRDSRVKRARVEEGLRLKQEVQDASKVYDWMGAPFEPPASKRREYISALGSKESNLTYWCQQQIEAGTAMHPTPIMAGLKVAEQQQYPVPERVCAQLVREMDAAQGIESDYKRVVTDPVFRWRISRTVAQEVPEYEGSLITAGGLQDGVMEDQMPKALLDMVPEANKAEYKARKLAKKPVKAGAAKAGQQQKPPAGAAAAAAAKGAAAGGDAAAAAAGAAAAAAAAGEGEDGEDGVGVKEEPGDEDPAETEMDDVDAAAAAAGDDETAAAAGGEETGGGGEHAAEGVAGVGVKQEGGEGVVGDAADGGGEEGAADDEGEAAGDGDDDGAAELAGLAAVDASDAEAEAAGDGLGALSAMDVDEAAQ